MWDFLVNFFRTTHGAFESNGQLNIQPSLGIISLDELLLNKSQNTPADMHEPLIIQSFKHYSAFLSTENINKSLNEAIILSYWLVPKRLLNVLVDSREITRGAPK